MALQTDLQIGDQADARCTGVPAGSPLGRLNRPVLLMNVPLSLSTQVPNNAWMEAMNPGEREIDLDRAISQFLMVYRHLARTAVIYLLPSTPGLQDQTYVSNLGAVLPHRESSTIIISRFRSKPRIGEARIGIDFFRLMGFLVEQPPETLESESVYFEGEADLKHIRSNLFVGAYGMRTSRNALTWAGKRFDMNIVPFRITDPYLYHLDCCMFRITDEAVLLCTSVADRASLRQLEQHCEIVDVPLEQARAGTTNGLLLSNQILCDSDIQELRRDSDLYSIEKSKIDFLEGVCSRFNRSLQIFCMSEFYKSGALLSCLVMPIESVRSDS